MASGVNPGTLADVKRAFRGQDASRIMSLVGAWPNQDIAEVVPLLPRIQPFPQHSRSPHAAPGPPGSVSWEGVAVSKRPPGGPLRRGRQDAVVNAGSAILCSTHCICSTLDAHPGHFVSKNEICCCAKIVERGA